MFLNVIFELCGLCYFPDGPRRCGPSINCLLLGNNLVLKVGRYWVNWGQNELNCGLQGRRIGSWELSVGHLLGWKWNYSLWAL